MIILAHGFPALFKYAAIVGSFIAVFLAIEIDASIGVAFIAALQGVIAVYFTYRQQRAEQRIISAKMKAESQDARVDRNDKLIDQLQEQIAFDRRAREEDRTEISRLTSEVYSLRRQIIHFEIGVMRLIKQITDLDQIPVWTPTVSGQERIPFK